MLSWPVKFIWILVSLALVLVMAGLWLLLPPSDRANIEKETEKPVPRGIVAEDPAVNAADSVRLYTTGQPVPQALASDASRAAKTKPTPAESGNHSETVVQTEMREMLDRALDGQVGDAVALAEQIKNCNSGFESSVQLESILDNWRDQVLFTQPVSFSIGGMVLTAHSFEELSGVMRLQLSQCLALREAATVSEHQRLTRLALEGDRIARYLYAMWPPNKDWVGEVEWENWLDYQDLATKFTWDNIAENEPLGVLALAQSYAGGMVAYFTPNNPELGELLFLTAFKCGVSAPWLDQKIGHIIDRNEKTELARPGGLKRLNQSSEEMVQIFCGR